MLPVISLVLLVGLVGTLPATESWVRYPGSGTNADRHVVVVVGEPIYRSEESMPELARILSVRHGFTCTVLFATDPETGWIDPQTLTNLEGLHHLDTADLLVLYCRSRELSDADMARFAAYRAAQKPVIALRTATHPFAPRKDGPYAAWRFDAPGGGYGREVLGTTWVAHLGRHKIESTRGEVVAAERDHPVLRGVDGFWGPSDVYALKDLPADCRVLMTGRLLTGLTPDDPLRADKPATPVVWTRELPVDSPRQRVLVTTLGHGEDFLDERFRRLLVNGVYWCLRLEDHLPASADVRLTTDYRPSAIGHGGHRKWVLPSEHVRQ